MVVRFTPTADEEPGRPRSARRERPADGKNPTGERIAPVTYLPGARPSDAAAEAMRRVESVRRADALRTSRTARGGTGNGVDGAESDIDGAGASRDDGAAGARSRADPRVASARGASRASNVSMHQLARRGMSRWELQQVLDKRGVDAATARAELDRLQSVGLLDDAALALTLVYTQHTRKGLGRSAIAQELRRRHIDQAIIDDALSEIADDDELQRALELAHKRAPQLRGLDDQTARRRLAGYLARKGYGSDVLRAAMSSVFDGDEWADDQSGDDAE